MCVAATRAGEGGGAAAGPVLTFAPCWRGRGRSGPVGLRGPAPCPCRTFPRGAPRLAVTALGTVHGRSEPQDRGPCPSAPCARGFLCSEEVEAQCASSAHIKLEGGGRRRHEPAREVGRAGPRHSPGGRKGERGPRLRPAAVARHSPPGAVHLWWRLLRASELASNYGLLGLVLLEGRAVLSGLRSSLGPL